MQKLIVWFMLFALILVSCTTPKKAIPMLSNTPAPATAVPDTPAPTMPGDLYQRAMAREFQGKTVDMMVVDYAGIFTELMAEFTEKTGIRVNVEAVYNIAFENNLMKRVAAGDAPEIAATSNLRLLTELARQGALVDPRRFVDETALLERYPPGLLKMATFPDLQGEIMAGIWHTYAPASVVFYASDDFEAAGYNPPETWDELISLSDQIVADGGWPWCIGNLVGEDTRWMTSIWMADILLHTQPAEVYQRFSRGELTFTSPEIQQALDMMGQIWFSKGYVYGGAAAIDEINLWDSANPMFEDPPGCWMHLQGSSITHYFPESALFGRDYDWFMLPTSQEADGRPQLVSGTLIAAFADRPEVGAVVDYFTRSESARPFIDTGNVLSPHIHTPLEWYVYDFMRSLAERMSQATAFYKYEIMTQDSQENLWHELSSYIDEKQAELMAATPLRKGHIIDLVADGSITIQPRGAGIEELELDIKNLLDELLDVEIPVGTYFVAGGSGVQNMVVREAVEVQVKPGELLKLLLDVACANMERDVPSSEDRFTVERQGSADLTRLVEYLETANVPYEVAQAAIWIVTDNANYDELGTLVSGLDLAQLRVINEPVAARAMQIVDLAGINITTRRIWQDRELIIAGVDAELATWLQQR